jgi:hypothetical protein
MTLRTRKKRNGDLDDDGGDDGDFHGDCDSYVCFDGGDDDYGGVP